jgi:ABC-type amino acid transport substrate-binding protein
MLFLLLFVLWLAAVGANNDDDTLPQLHGRRLQITVVPDDLGLVDAATDPDDDDDGVITYSGFFIEVLKALAKPDRANFTYEFKTPSGFGSLCPERLIPGVGGGNADPYPAKYRRDWGCAQSDVTDLPKTNYTTDMYLGAFYVTPERQRLNHFTIPSPLTTGTQAMVGTATHIINFEDLVRQQQEGTQGPACAIKDTAYIEFVKETFPTMELVEVDPGTKIYESLNDGSSCDVFILGHSFASSFVSKMSKTNRCTTDEGKVHKTNYTKMDVS